MNKTLIEYMNSKCFNVNHEQRKASYNEITIYNCTNFRCFLCSDTHNNLSEQKWSWKCDDLLLIKNIDMPLEKKILIHYIFSNENTIYFLPLEIELLIFEFCLTQKKSNEICKINKQIIDHAVNCRLCSRKIINLNTQHSCSRHIIPRVISYDDYVAYHI